MNDNSEKVLKHIILYLGNDKIEDLRNAQKYLEKVAKFYNVPLRKQMKNGKESLCRVSANFADNSNGYIENIPLLYNKIEEVINKKRYETKKSV